MLALKSNIGSPRLYHRRGKSVPKRCSPAESDPKSKPACCLTVWPLEADTMHMPTSLSVANAMDFNPVKLHVASRQVGYSLDTRCTPKKHLDGLGSNGCLLNQRLRPARPNSEPPLPPCTIHHHPIVLRRDAAMAGSSRGRPDDASKPLDKCPAWHFFPKPMEPDKCWAGTALR